MDRITLAGIEFYARGGVTQEEKEIGHRYWARVDLYLDLSAAARTDSLEDTIDYGQVFAVVVDSAEERPFNLLEALAGRIAARLIERFEVDRVTVEVRKVLPPIQGVVAYEAVEMSRTRPA